MALKMHPSLAVHVGDWLKSEIVEPAGVSVTALSEHFGVSRQALSTLLNGNASLSADMAKLKSVSGDLERLMSSARSNQAEVERVADTLNRMNLEYARLNKRVESNEEWVGSVDAFRRQVNASITQLQASVRALESAP